MYKAILITALAVCAAILGGCAAYGIRGGDKENIGGDTKTAVLTFSSFDGGGHSYSVLTDDPDILSYTIEKDYGKRRDPRAAGSRFDVIIKLRGEKPGTTGVTVIGRSPVMANDDHIYTAVVDNDLNVELTPLLRISELYIDRTSGGLHSVYAVTIDGNGYELSAWAPCAADGASALPLLPEQPQSIHTHSITARKAAMIFFFFICSRPFCT